MNSGKVILGVLAGAAAGALMGVLFAPHRGTVTRKKLVRKGGNYAEGVKEKINEFIDSVAEKFEQVKEDVSELADQKLDDQASAKKSVKTS